MNNPTIKNILTIALALLGIFAVIAVYFCILSAATWFLCVIFRLSFNWLYTVGLWALLAIITGCFKAGCKED